MTDSGTAAKSAIEVRRRRRRGGSTLESALVLPWFFFLFVGALDWGFYAHALISVESAARVAALYAGGQPSNPTVATLCPIVLNELAIVANVNTGMNCLSSPVVVTNPPVTGPDGSPAYTVSVTYTSLQMIAIPAVLANQITITRTVEVRPRV